MKPLAFCFLLSVFFFTGCGLSAKQLASQQAQAEFRKAIAAMKVCTQGSTYAEFREKRLALETCYTANESFLATTNTTKLLELAQAAEDLWNFDIETQLHPLALKSNPKYNDWAHALKTVKLNSGLDWTQINRGNQVQIGLTLVSRQCDDLLAQKQ